MSELPEGWTSVALSQLTNPTRARREPSELPDLPFVGMEHVESHTRRLLGTVPAKTMKSTATHFLEGDVLYGRLRPYLNKVYCAKLEGLCSGEFIVLPKSEACLSEYLAFYLSTGSFVEFANSLNQGDRPRVSFDQIASHFIPLPPLAEQRRIVAQLEAVLSRVDAAQRRLAEVPRILKRFRQSVLAAACSGRLTADWRAKNLAAASATKTLAEISGRRKMWLEAEISKGNVEAKRLKTKLGNHSFRAPSDLSIPYGWRWSSLLEACWLIVDCHNKTAPYVSEGIPLVRTTNIKGGKLILDEVKYITDSTYRYWSRRCPPEAGDILFTREAPMGESALIPQGVRLCMGQRMMLLRVFKDLLDANYISYALRDPLFLSSIEESSVGSGVKHLRVGDVETLVIPVPPIDEQQEIVSRVEALFKTADQLEARHRAARAHVDRLAQSVLARAFRGELVEQEAELARREGRDYEPAARLLDRVREGRDGGRAAGRPSRRTPRAGADRAASAAPLSG